jgi:hypothetical protein
MRAVAAAAFALLGAIAIVLLVVRRKGSGVIFWALAFAAALVWWSAIRPPHDGDWAPDVARQTTGAVNGDILTLSDVRDFDWRGDEDFTPHWSARSYDLTKLLTLDLFLSYWAGPQMAHFIFSFGFEGGDQLAWSVEVRRSRGGVYSPIADLFKTDPLVIIASDERDVVRVRSNVRGEDVRLYRLNTSPHDARLLLLQYVDDANALAAEPEFYNSITTNCTTAVARMVRAAGGTLPFDWRLIANGYLPGLLYDRGALDGALPLADLTALAHIDARARAADGSPEFSRLIRIGAPLPTR